MKHTESIKVDGTWVSESLKIVLAHGGHPGTSSWQPSEGSTVVIKNTLMVPAKVGLIGSELSFGITDS